MVSLYEHLGVAAGKEMGKEVYDASKALGIKTTIRQVNTKTYVGPVVLYPKLFLNLYFKNTTHFISTTLERNLSV